MINELLLFVEIKMMRLRFLVWVVIVFNLFKYLGMFNNLCMFKYLSMFKFLDMFLNNYL